MDVSLSWILKYIKNNIYFIELYVSGGFSTRYFIRFPFLLDPERIGKTKREKKLIEIIYFWFHSFK